MFPVEAVVTQPNDTTDTRPHCTPPYDSRTLGNKAVLQPAIGLSVSVRIVDAGYFPARSYMYHLPGSMTEMPGEVVTPHNLFAFPTVVE